MEFVLTADCAKKVVEPRAVAHARCSTIRTYTLLILTESGPATSREIRDGMPNVPSRWIVWGGCGRDNCGGHLQPLSWWPPSTEDVQRALVRFEREGLVRRVVVPGVQRHLWSA